MTSAKEAARGLGERERGREKTTTDALDSSERDADTRRRRSCSSLVL
jgi:hypothetical protein